MANSLVEVGIPATGTFYLELYPAAGGAIANGASGDDQVVRDGDNVSRGVATVTQALTGVHKYKLVDGSGDMISFGETEPLVDDTGTYKCHDPFPSWLLGMSDQLGRIEDQTGLITSGTLINIVNPVTPGGTVTMIKGSDYQKVNSTAISIPVVDPGGLLHAIFTDPVQVDTIIFGGGSQEAGANEVVGSVGLVNGVDLIYSAGVTTFVMESTSAQSKYAEPSNSYSWHIKGISPADLESVRVEGSLILQPEIAAAPH